MAFCAASIWHVSPENIEPHVIERDIQGQTFAYGSTTKVTFVVLWVATTSPDFSNAAHQPGTAIRTIAKRRGSMMPSFFGTEFLAKMFAGTPARLQMTKQQQRVKYQSRRHIKECKWSGVQRVSASNIQCGPRFRSSRECTSLGVHLTMRQQQICRRHKQDTWMVCMCCIAVQVLCDLIAAYKICLDDELHKVTPTVRMQG